MLIGRHLCNSTQKRVFLSKLPVEGGFPARNDNAHAGAWRRVREWRRRGIGSLPERRHGGWVAPSSAYGLPRGTPQGSPETGYARQAGRLRYVTQASRLPRAPSRSRCAAKRTGPSSWPRNRCKMLIGRHLCNSTQKRVFRSKLPAEGGFPARNDIQGGTHGIPATEARRARGVLDMVTRQDAKCCPQGGRPWVFRGKKQWYRGRDLNP